MKVVNIDGVDVVIDEEEIKTKKALKGIGHEVCKWIVDTANYLTDHPITSAVVLIPSALFYSVIFGCINSGSNNGNK